MTETLQPRILVVDDEPAVRHLLKNCLGSASYQVFEAGTGQQAVDLVRTKHPDLVVLDLGLPDLSGFEVARILREWSAVPIIVLSVRNAEEDIVKALDCGADDYLNKPFGVRELLARIRAALRRGEGLGQSKDEIFQSGPLMVDLLARQVSVNHHSVSLTPTEYDLLKAFVRDAGRVLTHSHLLRAVWGNGFSEEIGLLRVNISNLRRKLGKSSSQHQLIVTEPGVGYRLCLLPPASA